MSAAPAGPAAPSLPPPATPPEAWRGIASEQEDEISGRLGTLLRRRSRRLQRVAVCRLRPYHPQLWRLCLSVRRG